MYRWDTGLAGRPQGMHTRLLQAVSPGFVSWPSDKVSPHCFTGKVIHQGVCQTSDRLWTVCHICRHWLVDDKDPTVSFVKSRWATTGTLNKFQIPSQTAAGKAMANHSGYHSCSGSWFGSTDAPWRVWNNRDRDTGRGSASPSATTSPGLIRYQILSPNPATDEISSISLETELITVNKTFVCQSFKSCSTLCADDPQITCLLFWILWNLKFPTLLMNHVMSQKQEGLLLSRRRQDCDLCFYPLSLGLLPLLSRLSDSYQLYLGPAHDKTSVLVYNHHNWTLITISFTLCTLIGVICSLHCYIRDILSIP